MAHNRGPAQTANSCQPFVVLLLAQYLGTFFERAVAKNQIFFVCFLLVTGKVSSNIFVFEKNHVGAMDILYTQNLPTTPTCVQL